MLNLLPIILRRLSKRNSWFCLTLLCFGQSALPAATLLKYNFEGTNTLAGMTGYFTSTGVAGTSTPTVATVGTVNGYGTTSNTDVNNTASNGLRLLVNSSSATGTWTAGVDSGILALLTPNTLTNTGLLTLSFSLKSSRTNPVLVRVESYDSTTNLRTGGLRTLIYPASAGSYQRYTLDLDTMTPDGTGAFVPNNSKFKLYFEIGNTLGGDGWPTASNHELNIDNLNYASPKYYVKPSSPANDSPNTGLTEASPWKTISKAVNAAVPGDIIVLMGSEADQFVATGNNALASFQKPGTPDAWIVLKNYPGQRPVLRSTAWNCVGIARGSNGARYTASDSPSYIEIRGLTVRGYSFVDANGDRQLDVAYKPYIGLADNRSNSNGISIDGRYCDYYIHDVRIADNIVEYCSGGGISAIMSDRTTVENNISRYNTWWSIYGGSGISYLVSVDTELNSETRSLIQGNQSYGNEGMIPWRQVNGFSDGNGIIVDTNQIAGDNYNVFNAPNYAGRTLVQNNLVYNNGGSGIHSFKSSHVDIVHNIAYRNSASPRLVYSQMFAGYSNDVRMMNNILVAANNPTGNTAFNEPITSNSSNTNGTIYYQNNVFYGEGNNQSIPTNANFINNTTTNPLFLSASTDSATNDFRLRSTSPALNNGLSIAYRSALDFSGRPRLTTNTTPDRGAYQTQSSDIYAPIFTPQPGNFSSAQSVTLASDTAGAKIIYTTNGTTPTVDASGNATNGTVYTAAIPVGTATATLKAISWKSGSPASYVSNAIYTFNTTPVAIPNLAFDVWPLTDDGTRYVSLICNTPGAWVRYTLDGTTPSSTNGTIAPAAAIKVTVGNIVKAIAYKTGRSDSNVLSGNFVVRGFVGSVGEGSTTVAIGANKIRYLRFQAANDLTVTRIYAKLGAITGNYRAAIYSDNAGVPGTLQRNSTAAVTNPSAGWQSFTLSSALALTPKDSNSNALYYWLAIWSDSASASIYTTTSGGTIRESTSTFASTWPITAPTSAAPASGATYNYSILATTAYRPVLSAGANQTIASTASPATLTGTATDNSTLPVPLASGTLTTAWNKVSGPGTVTFANSAALATTATFSTNGTYVLRLTAQDPVFAFFGPVTSDVTITVGTPLIPTGTSLTSSLNFGYLGSSVTLTAGVSSGSGTPFGTVTFYDGTFSLGSATLVSGTAALATSALPAGTRVVTAVYSGNATYATSTSLTVNQTIFRSDGTLRQLAINAAGPDIPGSGFVADTGFTGGSVTTTTNTINLAAATNPAPQSVYQSERYAAAITYTLTGFVPSDAYLVRLHFSENWYGIAGRGGVANTVGKRLFGASINGTQRFTGFDIYAAAGAPNKAVVREFVTTADPSGQLVIAFASTLDNVAIDGLEIYTASAVDTWRADNFTAAQLDNPATSGLTADPDGDGICNLLEFALGSDPSSNSTSSLPQAGWDDSGNLTFSFLRARSEITYIIEGSSDLSDWTTIETNPGVVGDYVTVSDNVPPTDVRRFLRLRVVR